MVKCPHCRAGHPENTLFCEACGAYLPGDNRTETDPLATGELTWVEREEMGEAPGVDVTSPLGLKLMIPESRREVEVPLTKGVNIGRLDPAMACFPEVDLTNDDGLEKGVSRLHAKITKRGNEVFIEDLDSINGTFLNRHKLIPYLPQALKSGDELRLGKLILEVSFTK
jgi:hypothetical protein